MFVYFVTFVVWVAVILCPFLLDGILYLSRYALDAYCLLMRMCPTKPKMIDTASQVKTECNPKEATVALEGKRGGEARAISS